MPAARRFASQLGAEASLDMSIERDSHDACLMLPLRARYCVDWTWTKAFGGGDLRTGSGRPFAPLCDSVGYGRCRARRPAGRTARASKAQIQWERPPIVAVYRRLCRCPMFRKRG